MNNKGFTLVEILAVIAILAILAGIATPIVLTVSNNIKENAYKAKEKSIKEAAILYAEKNDSSTGTKITVKDLCPNFLSVDKDCNSEKCECQKNPINNNSMDDCKITITINERSKRYNATLEESCKN